MQRTHTQVKQDKRAAALRDNLRKRKALAKEQNQKDTSKNDTDKPDA